MVRSRTSRWLAKQLAATLVHQAQLVVVASSNPVSFESSVCSEEKTITKRVNIFRVFFSTLLAGMAARCKTVLPVQNCVAL